MHSRGFQVFSTFATFALMIALGITVYYVNQPSNLSYDSRSRASIESSKMTVIYAVLAAGDIVNQDGRDLQLNAPSGWIGSGSVPSESILAIRLVGQPIPDRSTITSALLEVTSTQLQQDSVSALVYVEKTPQPLPYSMASLPSTRILSGQSQLFTATQPWQAGERHTIDITMPLSEVLQLGGNQGLISIIIKGTGTQLGKRQVVNMLGSGNTPKLIINYSPPPGL